MRSLHFMSGIVAALFAAMPAVAHAGFLWPVVNQADGDGTVRLMASFSDTFPEAEIALKSDQWTVIQPNGEPKEFDATASSQTRTFIETTLTEPGTYRLSTGQRLGRKGEVVLLEGFYRLLGRDGLDAETLPEGTSILTSQTETVSDFYMTRGDQTDTIFNSRIGRLHVVPLDNPSTLAVGDTFRVKLLFEDETLPSYSLTWFSPSSSRQEEDPGTQMHTGDDGIMTVTLDKPGAHLFMARKIAPAPPGSDTDVRSYTTVLSFEVQ